MTKNSILLMCSLLAVVGFVSQLNAADRKFEKAVVIDNQEHTKTLPYHGKATDAPNQSTEFDHDVFLKVGCSVYVVRYRTQLDYLPAALDPGQTIEISAGKHVVYMKIPGNRESKSSIVRRDELKGSACPSSQASSSTMQSPSI